MQKPNRYVVGVDQSANHTGVVILDVSTRRVVDQALIEPQQRGIDRLEYVRDKLYTLLNAHTWCVLGIHEGYSFGSVHQSFLLGEIAGIVKLALRDRCGRVEECAPTALKKYIAGHGAATKGNVRDAINARWGVHYRDDNLADAYALAQLGIDLLIQHQTPRDLRDAPARPSEAKRVLQRAEVEVVEQILNKAEGKKPRPRARAHRPTPGVI